MAHSGKIDPQALFERLLKADQENEVTAILQELSLLGEDNWKPLGGIENNWSIAGNQQAEAAQAVAEKIINCIDAVLLYECQKRGIDPTSSAAPQSMEAAAEEFFGVREGSLETVDDTEALRKMADRIQFVAVGSKAEPSYLIVDTGEGQSPAAFPSTFLSLAKSNKWRIPFVQGKYNAGGTGALRFCGSENYQLIVSRRAPEIADKTDPTHERWGFTLVRRSRPSHGDNRRSSMFVYLVLDGVVPSFMAKEILLLPSGGDAKRPPEPYSRPITHGTGIKLYSFRWRSNGTATLEARFALNSALFRPVLPVRVTEARKGYKANYFSTTVRGGAVDDNPSLDLGPTSMSIALPNGLGTLPAELRVFALHEPPAKDEEVAEDETPKAGEAPTTKKRRRKRHSTGVVFTLNGQRHGEIAANVVARKIGFDFLADDLLLVVDVTHMPAELREDIWMTSRDRVADVEEKRMIEDEILSHLKEHQGLRDLNNKRKQEWVTQQVEEDEPLDILQELVSEDPALAEVFGVGTKLKKIMPTPGIKKPEPFVGKRFPTYFQLKKPTSVKDCPINRPCRLEFITDASDDYFTRGRDKGTLAVQPPGVNNGYSLYQGICTVRIKLPYNSKVGDVYPVTIEANDSTQLGPFVTKIQIRVTPAEAGGNSGGGKRKPRGEDEANGVNFPKIWEITKDKWEGFNFDDYSGMTFRGGVDGAPLEAYVNMDNRYLHHEKARSKDEAEQKLLNYYYKYGMTILALGLVHEAIRTSANGSGKTKLSTREACDQINPLLGGLASVVIPVVRRLAKTATKAVN